MSEPWIFESNNIDFSKDIENVLLRNESINKYLNFGYRDKYIFLVGPKGIGKTFLLNYKSYLYRKNHSTEIKFCPPLELAENLMVFFTQFSKDEIIKFQAPDIWENIWKFVLLSVACKTSGIDVEKHLDLNEVDFTKVSNALTFILSDRKALSKNLSLYLPKLIALAGSIQNAVVLFVDGIDQAVDSFVDQKFYDFETYSDTPTRVWANIHVGIAKSIYDIIQLNSHVRIYTTLRSEAFKLIPGGLAMNLDGYATHLNYSPKELKEIFENNIKLMDKDKLFNPAKENLIEKFLGFSLMSHPFAKDKSEDAFDFLLRHTLGRPREVVQLGNKLFYEKVSKVDYKFLEEEERIEDVRFFITEKSEEILTSYLKELISSFDEDYLIHFLKKVQFNIFQYKILNDQEKEFLKTCYNVGLIGVLSPKVDKNGNKIKVQSFKKAGEYVYDNMNQFPKSDYYITHPLLDNYLIKLFNLEFYNQKNIIGDKYVFDDPEHIYDFAISYSNLDRGIVEAVTYELKNNNCRIFYDKDFEKELIGVELIDYLYEVYRKSAKNVIIFLSNNYLSTKWTSLEFEAIKQKLINDFNSKFIKIIRLDNVAIPNLLESRVYIESNGKSPKQLADILSSNDD